MKTNHNILQAISFTVISIFFITGCHPSLQLAGAYNKDVSKNLKLWGKYNPNTEYVLLIDVFIRDRDTFVTDEDSKKEQLVLVPPHNQWRLGRNLYSAPDSVAQYENHSEGWLSVKGVIEAGTKIRTKSLRKKGTLMYPPSLTVFAEILDGDFKGKIVSINDLSKVSDYDSSPHLLKPAPGILKEVRKDG